ncbi:MAG: alanine--tRNA ligase [Endomicrobium sp.]|nr:alanine--tRNA ligase [Endomicrobium sp.]
MNEQSSKIRAEFLNFFNNNGCTVVSSDSLVPTGDKTLLFTSAGMVQFKQHFLGQSKDSFTRAASCQKCFRMSDIEQVGITTRHLTFFEMLGNFSFGDYFKKEAIIWAWEFLTKNMALPKDKLYITVYKDDTETVEIWKKIVPENKIIRMGDETNFWNMGDTGPCGPCSEVLIDLGPEMSCGKPTCGLDCNCDRYLEIWNLVFTQFDRQADGSLKNLPRKNIDTGMGLERIVAVANGKKNIFDTDLFMPTMENAAEILKIKNEGKNISKLRMIADHSRAVTFLISDGIFPSNEGRGYVLRRILRRALRQGKPYGYDKPFINELASTVFNIMEPAYPGLASKLSNIKSIIKIEEEKFLETLESGSEMLSDIVSSYKSKGVNVIAGKDVFKLYDTYGFPYDLTKEIASENGLTVDENGFKSEQQNAQEKSRAAWGGSGEKDVTFYSILHKKTNDTVFKGYENYVSKGKVLSLVKDGKEVVELSAGDGGEIILSQTSFYAQSGGQSSDKGRIENNNFEAVVEDVSKPIGSLFVHKVKVVKGSLKTNNTVSTIIDIERRKQIARHHTATHILHKALREALGEHVVQAGSLVTSDYLRFDFTHFSAIKKEDLIKIEKKVNSVVRANSAVCIETMDIIDARNAGAMALFGEKYGKTVRAVSVKNEDSNDNYSMELCGGTHVNRTGDIGTFKIVSESSVAAGVRRIKAVAGISAEDYILDEEAKKSKILEELDKKSALLIKLLEKLNERDAKLRERDDLINEVSEKLDEILDPPLPPEKESSVSKAQTRIEKIESEINAYKSSKIDYYAKKIEEVNGVNFLRILVDGADVKSLREMSDQLKAKLKSALLLIVSKSEGKAFFIVSATADCVQKGINAGKFAKAFAVAINGSGGGKPDFAQGGTKDLSNLEHAIENAQQYI